MDILKKITDLREERHWSEYQLAVKSGLTQSTISSWYRKNMIPSVLSLAKICDAFGITLSQFFVEEGSEIVLLNKKQIEMLNTVSKLNAEQYDALLNFLKKL